MQGRGGGLICEGGTYMRDTTVYTYTADEEQHCPKRVLHSKGVKEDMAH